jgi:hypothetical protein
MVHVQSRSSSKAGCSTNPPGGRRLPSKAQEEAGGSYVTRGGRTASPNLLHPYRSQRDRAAQLRLRPPGLSVIFPNSVRKDANGDEDELLGQVAPPGTRPHQSFLGLLRRGRTVRETEARLLAPNANEMLYFARDQELDEGSRWSRGNVVGWWPRRSIFLQDRRGAQRHWSPNPEPAK